MSIPASATMLLGEWTPIYKGIEHARGTNTPGGGFNNQHVVYAIKVDLDDPDIRVFTDPRIDGWGTSVYETYGYTVPDFLKTNNLQIAVNASQFAPSQYYLPPKTPMNVAGLTINEGILVSDAQPSDASSIIFDINNNASIIHTNWPGTNTAGIYTAVSGVYPIVIKGENVGARYLNEPGFIHEVNPRTLFGLSEDGRYLYILAIDGRQPGYSEGADDIDSGAWMVLVGAYDAVNFDGGGSTCLAMQNSLGEPITLNRSNAFADSGRERTVGSHFGIYAKRLPAFINDIVIEADDHEATITWTTVEPATSQVEFGLADQLGTVIAAESTEGTNYSAILTGLTANTGYYFKVSAENASTNVVSELFYFTTTNNVVLQEVFPIDTEWKYTRANLDGTQWTNRVVDESTWSTGTGILWADRSGSFNPLILPEGSQMPISSSTGYPYFTYYFRKHFNYQLSSAAEYFNVSANIDDGAVFYLNGHEIKRLRMPDAPAPIRNDTLANVPPPCDGHAICPDDFAIAGEALNHLVEGDNVLAVEVHNYNTRSGDITFGMSLVAALPRAEEEPPSIQTEVQGSNLTIKWTGAGFILQESTTPTGSWQDVQPLVSSSPFETSFTGENKYFRLRSD